MSTHDEIRSALEELLTKCLISYTEIQEEQEGEDILRFNVKTNEPALVIGRHADTLFSLQQLFRIIVRKKHGVTLHVIVDVDNYRKAQETGAAQIALHAAEQVRETGRAHELVPMPSYKRRAVHTFFAQPEYRDMKVYSVGEGDQRRVRVEPSREENPS